MAQTRLRKIGNSYGVTLPVETLRALGVAEGDTFEVAVVGGQLHLVPRVEVDAMTEEQVAVGDAFMRRYAKAMRILAQ